VTCLAWRTAYEPEHMDSRFPEKLFYRIGDVAEITGVKPHVLRYWETEFSGLHPRKTRAGQRIYARRDVELILEIKKVALRATLYHLRGEETSDASEPTCREARGTTPSQGRALRRPQTVP